MGELNPPGSFSVKDQVRGTKMLRAEWQRSPVRVVYGVQPVEKRVDETELTGFIFTRRPVN